MKTKLWLSLLTLAGVVISIQPAILSANAQTYQPTNRSPAADNTLGTQVSGDGNNFNITGGVNKGQTLFHSFTDFSVPTNGQANFTNPVGNRDIITRVTGNLFSDINGTVNSNGANFFLINPNGIVFGTNARLNVGKAFVGSTANSMDLVDAGGRTITFGTNPGMGIKIDENVPNESNAGLDKSLTYMGLQKNENLIGKKINYVFIGSCTNSRIEDLRAVADFVKGKQKAENVTAWIVPGSQQVAKQAEAEGLTTIFEAAGFELRQAGCSACLGMNEDKIPSGEYCVSTSNRNFEGRQGPGARTILASPLTAAATAIAGMLVDVRSVIEH